MNQLLEHSQAWMEDETFFYRPGPRFDAFLCQEYQRYGRHDDALMLAWRRFQASPSLARYQLLADQATKAGAWCEWRSRAMALLRGHVEEVRKAAASAQARAHRRFFRTYHPPGASVLVEVLLWEGDHEAAWEEAQRGGCPHRLWMCLADARKTTHPSDAIPVYLREVDQLIALKNITSYTKAVSIMAEIRDLRARAGQPDEFSRDVSRVRAAHASKRNLMKLFDAKGW